MINAVAMHKVVLVFLLMMTTGLIFCQSGDRSLSTIKEEYFEKRKSFQSSSTKKLTTDQQSQLDALVAELKTLDPNSFEYNLVVYVNGNYNTNLQSSLFTAYELNPTDETVLKEMAGFYAVTFNTAKQKEYLLKIKKYYTASELAYYKDAMPSTKSLLFTSGQEDMFGFLLAQVIEGVGSEVQVVCMDMMKNDEYREMVSNNCGITDMTFLGNEKNYVKTILTGGTKKIFISATVPQDYFSACSDKLYITGLVYQYGNIDQLTALNDFWKKVKAKDLSQISLSGSAEKKLYGNYLPALITLYMLTPGDQVLKTTIQAIAEKVSRTEEVNEILKEIEAN
ncbi:MAG: hypothetical protein IPM74_04325 [Crocinitomicaceae bacterium]|nr:hypothetical protein [Crocinitomicaceae bacterium]MBK8925135.1 hypothetical protein [Crocinitomicaceae bacterium]